MCFSATASFATGGALSAAGALTLSKAKKKTELLFASIPLLLGIQQVIEGTVWLSFGSPMLNTIATYAYVLFSHVLWPMFVPLAILLIESDPVRRKILKVFLFVGVGVGAHLAYVIAAAPVTASIVNRSIAYDVSYAYPLLGMALYLIATCGSPLVSSYRILNMFGVALVIAFGVSTWFFMNAFFSVWCFFAAALSVFIFAHVIFERKK